MHMRAIRTLKVVVVHNHNFGVRIPTHRTSFDVDLLHVLRIWIFAQVQLRHADERLLVFREQELVVLLLAIAIEGDGQRVIIRELARARTALVRSPRFASLTRI